MKYLIKNLTMACVGAFVTSNCVAEVDPIISNLKTTLQARLKEMRVRDIPRSPIKGPYEVNVNSYILHSDANGDYVLIRELMNAATRENLTEARLSDINRINFSKLPLENSIKLKKGGGSQKSRFFPTQTAHTASDLNLHSILLTT